MDTTGTTTYTLDRFGRETAATTPMTASGFSFAYRADGLRSSQVDPSGATTSYTYDKLGRMTGKSVADAQCTSGTCATLTGTYNRAGQRLTELQDTMGTPGTDGTATFTYDKVGRLTGFDSPLGGTATDQAYGWQKVPNRDSLTIGTGSPVTTTFDDADRITSSGFSHDADGRMTARTGQTMEWDSLGRLKKVKTTGGATVSSYTYDALDRLREVTRSGTVHRFRYLGTSTQRIQTRNVTTGTNGRSIAWDRTGTMLADYSGLNSGIRYYGTDAHRDTAWTADSTGAVTATYRWDPWGGLLASSGTLSDWRFQGSWYDTDADLYWVVTRWYATSVGRFLSEDSLLGEPTNPMSRHLYAYVEGDPVGGWDADGRATTFDGKSKTWPDGPVTGTIRADFTTKGCRNFYGQTGYRLDRVTLQFRRKADARDLRVGFRLRFGIFAAWRCDTGGVFSPVSIDTGTTFYPMRKTQTDTGSIEFSPAWPFVVPAQDGSINAQVSWLIYWNSDPYKQVVKRFCMVVGVGLVPGDDACLRAARPTA